MLSRWHVSVMVLFGALVAMLATVAGAQQQRSVTVRTPSAIAVGAAESIARVGWLVPQLLVAHYAQGVRRRKPIYLAVGWGRAGCLALLAGILWAGERVSGALGEVGVLRSSSPCGVASCALGTDRELAGRLMGGWSERGRRQPQVLGRATPKRLISAWDGRRRKEAGSCGA